MNAPRGVSAGTVVRGALPRAFLRIGFGQTVSAFGSSMTAFALSVWVFGKTGSLLAFGAVVFVNAVATALAAPWLGVLADRLPRRRLMFAADAATALLTAVLLTLVLGGGPALWQVLLLVAAAAVLTAAHQIAYRALVPGLVGVDDLARANGLIETGLAASQLLAPLVAGLLVARVGLGGILALDLATFAVAASCLVAARVEEPLRARDAGPASPLAGLRRGAAALAAARGRLLAAVLVATFAMASLQVLLTPLILLRHDTATLGFLLSAGGLGMAAGGVSLMARRRPPGLRLVVVAQAGMGTSLVLLAVAPQAFAAAGLLFALFAFSQCGAGAVRSLWQAEIAPALRGRAFAALAALSALLLPPACLGMPWIAERVLQPWLQRGGSGGIGRLFGVAPGAGAALLLAVLGLVLLLSAAVLWRGTVRRGETAPRTSPDAI